MPRTTVTSKNTASRSALGPINQRSRHAADTNSARKPHVNHTIKTPDDILARIRQVGNPNGVAGMAHFGIATDGRYGLSVPAMRRIAKEIGRDHALALALWDTGQSEARAIACMIEDPAKVTSTQADRWARGIESWDICDGFAYDLISRTPMRWRKPSQWAASKHEFVRRAAF